MKPFYKDYILEKNKEIFFKHANYTDPIKYEDQYENEICKRENREIEKILNTYIPDELVPITDIGCGTGLGKSFLTNPYTGIDRSGRLIEYCRRHHHEGLFLKVDAEDYAEGVSSLNPIFLFSLDYLDLYTIETFIKKTERIFIAIHYNKPYLSETSVYSGKAELFNAINPPPKRKLLYELFKKYNGTTFKLLDEEFYFVTIIEKA